MQRFARTVMIALLLLSGVAPDLAVAAEPTVVAGSPLPLTQALERLRAFGLAEGMSGRNPNTLVTRAELVRLLVQAAGHTHAATLAAGARPYPDTAGHPDAGYILVARNMGLLDSPTGAPFEPDRPATRGEAATLVARLLGLKANQAGSLWPDAALDATAAGPTGAGTATALPPLADQPILWGELAVLADHAFGQWRGADGLTLYQRQFDRTPPELALDPVVTTTDAAQVVIAGTARGANAIAVNGREVARGPGSMLRFRVGVPLIVGSNQIEVTARDYAGNTISQTPIIERTPPPPARLQGPTEVRVRAGETVHVAVAGFDAAGNSVPTGGLSAIVSGGIGTFDAATGSFTAGQQPGSGSLRFQVGPTSLTVPVVVEPAPVARVELSLNPPAAKPGQIVQVNLRAFDTFGQERADIEPVWQLEAPSIVFDRHGRQLIASEPGRFPLVATVEGVSAETVVAIWDEVAGLQLEGPAEVLGNETALAQFTVTALDRFGTPVQDARNRVTLKAEGASVVSRFGNALTSLYLNAGRGTFYVKAGADAWGQVVTVSAADYLNPDMKAVTSLAVLPQEAAAVRVTPETAYLISNDADYTNPVTIEVVDAQQAPLLDGVWEIDWQVNGPAREVESGETAGQVVYVGGEDPPTVWLEPETGALGPVTITGSASDLASGSGTIEARVASGPAKLSLSANQVRATVTDQPEDGIELTVAVTDELGVPSPYTGKVYVSFSTGLVAVSGLMDNDVLVDTNQDGNKDRVELAFAGEYSRTFRIAVTRAGGCSVSVSTPTQKLTPARTALSWVANTDPSQLAVQFEHPRLAAVVPFNDPTGTLQVQVVDQYGNSVPRRGVEVTLEGLEGTEPTPYVYLNETTGPLTIETNTLGRSTAKVRISPSTGRDLKVTITAATFEDQEIAIDPERSTFEITAASTIASQLELTWRSPSGNRRTFARAGSPVVLEAVVRDPYGEPMTGMEGLLATVVRNQVWAQEEPPADDYGTPSTAEEIKALTWTHLGDTDPEQAGVYHLTLYPAKPGEQTVTVELDMWRKRLKQTARLPVKPGLAHGLTLKGVEETLEVHPGEWVPVTLAVSDAWGNPTTGAESYHILVEASDGALVRADPRGLDLTSGKVTTMLHEVTLYVMVPEGKTPGTLTFREQDGRLLSRTYALTLPPEEEDPD